ncbi:DUF3908 family protein [Ectobacillus sp. JY-23]|uniref:DUF3908 family protein n=1 Tax=Ectobacillus sp. JY-23 TaxID=2933872 RepID=UPI001FF16B8B|nr:DUF3908 family protein [Ectobacillus sp. JY-23]UOY92887.1 DUF3908 family protein [Ectobacillus sp. JY-23]
MQYLELKDILSFAQNIAIEGNGNGHYIAATLIEDLYSEEEIKVVYPRHIFPREEYQKKSEILVFLDDKLCIVTADNKEYDVTIIKYQEIRKVNYKANRYEQDPAVLIIELSNGSEIILDSNQDCNVHWVFKYNSKIKQVFHLFK